MMDRYTGFAPCPCCDGLGEWDEGPLPASSGATEPDYRQVICSECNGRGAVWADDESPRTLDDLENEEWDAGTAAWFASIVSLVYPDPATKWFGDIHEMSRGEAA